MKNLSESIKIQLFLTFVGLVGYGLLISSDWKVALGVFLIHWHINGEISRRVDS